jgi:hypothetical protein
MCTVKEKKRILLFSSKTSSFMYTLTMMLSRLSDKYAFEVVFVLPLVGDRPRIIDYLSQSWDAIIIDARPGQEVITQVFYHELSADQRRKLLVNGHPRNGQFALALWQHPLIQLQEVGDVLVSLDAVFNC